MLTTSTKAKMLNALKTYTNKFSDLSFILSDSNKKATYAALNVLKNIALLPKIKSPTEYAGLKK